MPEWASLRSDVNLRKGHLTLEGALLPLILGILLARGPLWGMYPFGLAFCGARILVNRKGYGWGIAGILIGILSLSLLDILLAVKTVLIILILSVTVPYLRGKKNEGVRLGILTVLITAGVSFLAIAMSGYSASAALKAGFFSIITGCLAVIYFYALTNQEAVWRGEFSKEHGIAWLFILFGVLSGLYGLQIGAVNLPVVVLSFFILFISHKYGAGTAAGVGALLGFMPNLEFGLQNMVNAGIYGLAGFCSGAFQKFGKLGIGVAFSALILMLTVFLRQEIIFSQLVSSALGLFLFLLWPMSSPRKEFLKPKPVPEVETTVSKVKTVAEIFDQMAYSFQAAEAEIYQTKPEISELINVLVERVCKTCPTMDVCWTREFYRTYHYIFNLFELVEREGQLKYQDLSPELKRYCGRIKEILLGIGFIIEHEKNLEAWRARLATNQEALSRQFQSVSQVIGHLAKELNAKHNFEQVKSDSLSRRRRNFLDIGVASFIKSGNGISGDNYASLAFSPTQHAFVLSDGMGVGESAAKISSTSLSLLEQLLTTGFEPKGAVQALNSILVLRSPEESFATIDMAILNMDSDLLQLIKVGAAPSYIKGQTEVRVVSSSCLPAGILNQIEIPVIMEKLGSEEALVLVTDGIQDILKDGTDWLKEFLAEIKSLPAQELAEAIVRKARELGQQEMYDDGVVMVVRKILE